MPHVKRIFYPIGQGAFYSEQIDGKTIVYDCGLWWNERKSKRAERLVKSAFPEKHVIDILFISHFDFDHVSLIPLLIDHYTVKRIVMPLLDPDDEIFLSKLYESLEEELGTSTQSSCISKLISNPQTFGSQKEGIQIFQISTDVTDNDNPAISIDNLSESPTPLNSGTKIQLSDLADWVWVPYNVDAENRSPALSSQLSELNLDLTKLKTDSDYFQENRASIRSAYAELDGNVNENSLFLYSGPVKKASHHYSRTFFGHVLDSFRLHSFFDYRWFAAKPGCIYTGDGDLNITTLSDTFKNYWDSVGTIQIPHHGSRKSFNFGSINDAPYLCPISVGVNNSYGHPAPSVISTLLENSCYPGIVSEKSDSMLISIFRFKI